MAGVVFGIERGFVNAVCNVADAVGIGHTLLGNQCNISGEEVSMSDEAKGAMGKISKCMEVLKESDDALKAIAQRFANIQGATAATF